MPSVGIRELSRNPSKVVDDVTTTRRPALVTRHGKLVAAIVPIDDAALEDWVLANAADFVEDREAALRERAAGQAVPLGEFLAELDEEE